MTIRRDLDALAAAGMVSRHHGGAVMRAEAAVDADTDLPFARVVGSDTEDKVAVARLAATQINDGDVVLLDIGTTTMMLARQLRRRALTVITANLAAFDVLRDEPRIDLILLGGQLRRTYHSLVGSLTEDALRQVRADVAFLGASGVRLDGTGLDTTAVEVPVKRALIKAADRVVLLADRNKFPGTGALRVCVTDDIDVVITNGDADPMTTLAAARQAGVAVFVA